MQKTKKITYEDIIELYKQRFVNEKKIKKYETIDEQALSKVVSKIKEEYLAFLYNVITVNDVQFSVAKTQYCAYFQPDASGRIRTKVFARINDGDESTFLHELGHATAQCYYDDKKVMLQLIHARFSPKGTLASVLKGELSQNVDKIKEQILEEHRLAVEPTMGKEKYQSLADNAEFLKEYYKVSKSAGGCVGMFIASLTNEKPSTPKQAEKMEKYNEMHKEVMAKSMLRTQNELKGNIIHKRFREENDTVLDVLSSVCDMQYPYDLQVHTQNYYAQDEELQVDELWANLFAIKVAGREDLAANVRKYLPETYETFELLFQKINEVYQMQSQQNNR